MIIAEHIEGKIRRYSDAGMLLHKVGTEEYYDEAIDIPDAPYSYEESSLPIDDNEPISEVGTIASSDAESI